MRYNSAGALEALEGTNKIKEHRIVYEDNNFQSLKKFDACNHCQYYENEKCMNQGDCFWLDLERKLIELDQLKEIEKELGIDLITLFKALKDGVWVKNEFGQIYHTDVYLYDLSLSHFSDKNRFCFVMNNNVFLLFSELKQHWSLTKKELENE